MSADEHVDIGVMLHEQSDLNAALKHYREALRLVPNHVTAAFNLGVALEELGRFKQSAKAYQKCLESDPLYADAHFNLAGVLEKLGDKRGAIRHFAHYRSAGQL